MPNMKSKMADFLRNESGATSIEYALIAAGIFLVIIASVNAIGTDVIGVFQDVSNGFN